MLVIPGTNSHTTTLVNFDSSVLLGAGFICGTFLPGTFQTCSIGEMFGDHAGQFIGVINGTVGFSFLYHCCRLEVAGHYVSKQCALIKSKTVK